MQPLIFPRSGILLKILPLTLLFGFAKWGAHLLGWEVWEFDPLIAALIGAATFVLAFTLSGTFNDYRIGENMVAQIATAIATIQDTGLMVAAGHAEYDVTELSQGLAQVMQTILEWLTQNKSAEPIDQAIVDLNPLFAQMEAFTTGPIISRLQAEQSKIRFAIVRIQVIRETDFLAPTYVLLELFLAGVATALLLIQEEQLGKTLVVSSFLVASFLYLLVLIRDLDNPFQYDGKSCIEVDLSPLTTTIDRLATHLPEQN